MIYATPSQLVNYQGYAASASTGKQAASSSKTTQGYTLPEEPALPSEETASSASALFATAEDWKNWALASRMVIHGNLEVWQDVKEAIANRNLPS